MPGEEKRKRYLRPDTIPPERYHEWEMKPDVIAYDQPGKVCNPNSARTDIARMREIQIILATRGELDHYVSAAHIKNITGWNMKYISMLLWRLARSGFIERYKKKTFRPRKDVGEFMLYYCLKNTKEL